MDAPLPDLLDAAIDRRGPLLDALAAEGTDIVRLLHGPAEGAPGVSIERHGPVLLVQTWREALAPGALDAVARVAERVAPGLIPVWNHRAPRRGHGGGPRFEAWHAVELPEALHGRELGLALDVHPRGGGHDPRVFVDLRAGRRQVRAAAAGRSVLNLFAYTGVVGVQAAAGGAREVWQVDHSATALEVAAENAARNGLSATHVASDCLPVMRQLAGLPAGGRRGKVPRALRVAARTFDLVVLDPPRFAKSPFGAIDVVRDYPSLLKPALLATAEGGAILATNHVSTVSWDEWVEVMRRAAAKAGRPLRDVQRVPLDADVPSPDGAWPLKLAWLTP